ncbi:MAG: carboxypeptidase-like regulatory domain-containing protein [Gemmatimonadota bacterium]
MFSLRKVVAIVVPIVFVACDPGFEMSVADLFGVTEEVEEETNPRAYDRLCFEGYVRSSVDDQPVSGASVAIVSYNVVAAATRTESSGYYALNCARHSLSGGATLRARKDGWSVRDIRGIYYSADPQRYDFTLEPE